MDKNALLKWQLESGVDETIGETPTNYFASNVKKPEVPFTPTPIMPLSLNANSRTIADACNTLVELEQAVRNFDGCSLKKTAGKTVFADGNPNARVMIIGEAPGVQEDIQGIPFCGPSGMLLDRMLAAIGLNRKDSVYISNTVFWRPPGNRQPSPEETAICLPFVEKHIAFINPALLILSGGTATTTLLNREQSISRLRGALYSYNNAYLNKPIPVAVTYHPSYLLRSPTQKRLAWADLLMIQEFLKREHIYN